MSMKKLLSTALALFAAFSFTACDESSSSSSSSSQAENATVADADIWCAPASEKILATQSKEYYEDVRTDKIVLTAARNDYESGQIIVTPTKNLHYTVALSDLTGAGYTIDNDNFEVYTQLYAGVVRNWYGNGAPTGQYPDALLPQENAIRFDRNGVQAGRNGGAWLEFYVPDDAPAGEYTGTATVKIGETTKNIPVELYVYDFEIPAVNSSKSLFTINSNMVATSELDSSSAMFDKYIDKLNEYRVCSTGLGEGDPEKYGEKAWYWYEKGLRTFGIPSAYGGYSIDGFTTINPETLAGYIVDLAKTSVEKNVDLVQYAAYYNFYIDEPFYVDYPAGKVNAFVTAFERGIELALTIFDEDETFLAPENDAEKQSFMKGLRESIASVPNVVTDYNTDEYGNALRYRDPIKNTDGSLFTYDDRTVALCPKPDGINSQEARAGYENGYEKWIYTCNEPRYPYPTYHLDDTMASHAALAWMMAEYDIVGNLYWVTNYITNNAGNVKDDYYAEVFTNSGSNGDGTILYPGKPFDVDGPLGSVRLDAIRDGQEEYEIIRMIKDSYAAKGVSADAIIGRITSSVYNEASIIGGGAEYEAAREILYSVAQATLSNAALMITEIDEKETETGKLFTFHAVAADGAEVFVDGEKATPVDGKYIIEKGLTEDKNYLSLRAVKDGAEISFNLYLGGKQLVWKPTGYQESDFTGNVATQALEENYYVLDLNGTADAEGVVKSNVNISHESLSSIGANTAHYIIDFYNFGDEALDYKIYVNYSDYGMVEFSQGTLEAGYNRLDITSFVTVNWAQRGTVKSIRITVYGAGKLGVGDIMIYGV